MEHENFKHERWRRISYASRHSHKTPPIPGLYCFIEIDNSTKSKRVIYIGKSKNLSVRIKPWHKVEHTYNDLQTGYSCYLVCKIMPTLEFDRKEKEYIRRLKPWFNVQHNPNITRKIIYSNGETIYRHRNVG